MRIETQPIRRDRPKPVERPRARRVRILVGVELDDAGAGVGLLARHVGGERLDGGSEEGQGEVVWPLVCRLD